MNPRVPLPSLILAPLAVLAMGQMWRALPTSHAEQASSQARVRVVDVQPLEDEQLSFDVDHPEVLGEGEPSDTAEPLPEICSQDPHADPRTYAVRGLYLHQVEVTLADYGYPDWVYPIDEDRRVGSPFGWRRGVFDKSTRTFHNGVDIGCAVGEPIYAAADGVVVWSTTSGSAGRFVRLEHGEFDGAQVHTRYLHLSRSLVRQGQEVEAGQIIGRCGSTGASTSPHLHFEVVLDSERVHPFRRPLPDMNACLTD
jgi:murein DD-endopeptidase MepM/ murein hydrolase activator NlpD